MKKYKYVNEEARKAWKKIDKMLSEKISEVDQRKRNINDKIDKQIHDNPLGEGFAHKDKKDKHNKKHSK